jgi:alpha-beta hydrolase superfamily lysophospholipase
VSAFGDMLELRVMCEVSAGARSFPVYAITLGNPAPGVPAVGYFGGVHGVERIGSAVVLAFLRSVIMRLRWDETLHHQLEHLRMVFMPVVNPGGLARGTRANPAGVDLMRNAPLDARDPVPFLLGGQRFSPWLPWYRGRQGEPMQPESQALCQVVEGELLSHDFSIAVDCHSGFGTSDRIWFPYASTRLPIAHLPEMHALAEILDQTQLHHPYVFEPQSSQYLTHGDLWDHLTSGLPRARLHPPAPDPRDGVLAVGQEEPAANAVPAGLLQPPHRPPPRPGLAPAHPLAGVHRARRLRPPRLGADGPRTGPPPGAGPAPLVRHGRRERADHAHICRPDIDLHRSGTWLLLRGLTREAGHWGDFPQPAAGRLAGARILAIDLPGNGTLHRQASPSTIPAMVAACRAELATRGVAGPVHLVAMSLGAMVAVAWAAATRMSLAAACSSTAAGASTPASAPATGKLAAADVGTPETDGPGQGGGDPAPDQPQGPRMCSTTGKGSPGSTPCRHATPCASCSPQPASRPRHRSLECRCWCCGGQDALVSPECSLAIARRWDLPVHLHPDAGHDLPLDDGAWVAARIKDWAAWLDSAPPQPPRAG